MLNEIKINPAKQKLIIYIILTVVTLAVFWQVRQYDFVNYDDNVYVTENSTVKSGLTADGLRWAFSTKYLGLWNPLVWVSLMVDYQLYGLNPGGYHLTNLFLHILSTLLLFWLFSRMTQAVWPSAFVAALFALHPLHVESVAWITERKDVLSVFFGMLTLCLYVYYTEKPVIKRYLLAVSAFILALLSKPMVVTLPVLMILLDYWPLDRLQSRKYAAVAPEIGSDAAYKETENNKAKKEESGDSLSSTVVPEISELKIAGIIPVWQLREKAVFFILSAVFSAITLYTPDNVVYQAVPLETRMANAPVAFLNYVEKTFLPHDMAIFYPVAAQIPVYQILCSTLLIILVSAAVILMAKRLPYLFVGWFWYMITVIPVLGVIQIGRNLEADRYHYLPSIGIAVALAWGIPASMKSVPAGKKILFPAAVAFLAFLAFMSWRQCSYWRGSVELWSHALQVTENNDYAFNNLGTALSEAGKLEEAVENYNKALAVTPDDVDFINNRGNAYARLGKYDLALADLNKAISLNPEYLKAYLNRGVAYAKTSRRQLAIEDFNKAIGLNRDNSDAYLNRGIAFAENGLYDHALEDLNKAISLKPNVADSHYNRGIVYYNVGRQQNAFEDFNEAIRLKPDYAEAYNYRGGIYLMNGYEEYGCKDAKKACSLGNCELLEMARGKGFCH